MRVSEAGYIFLLGVTKDAFSCFTGKEAGTDAGQKAGQDAGKKAGEAAGEEAGKAAGLKAAADALGIPLADLMARKSKLTVCYAFW